jgi:hypothetical protein
VLTNLDSVHELVTIWEGANGLSWRDNPVRAVFSVDDASFRSAMTIDDGGDLASIYSMNHLQSPDLFREFVLDHLAFRDFLAQQWDDAYSSSFVDQVEPIAARLTCCLVYIVPVVNGKGNHVTVATLRSIAETLERRVFKILGYPFDGDSCFNALHDAFQASWPQYLSPFGPIHFSVQPLSARLSWQIRYTSSNESDTGYSKGSFELMSKTRRAHSPR